MKWEAAKLLDKPKENFIDALVSKTKCQEIFHTERKKVTWSYQLMHNEMDFNFVREI